MITWALARRPSATEAAKGSYSLRSAAEGDRCLRLVLEQALETADEAATCILIIHSRGYVRLSPSGSTEQAVTRNYSKRDDAEGLVDRHQRPSGIG
jgi:hypothetical protein